MFLNFILVNWFYFKLCCINIYLVCIKYIVLKLVLLDLIIGFINKYLKSNFVRV